MTTYHDISLDFKKTRIPSETFQGEEWFDLKRVLVALGYASYTTHQENSLRESGVRLHIKRKRIYANMEALEYMRDNIAMSVKKKANLVKLLSVLKGNKLEKAMGFSLRPETIEEWLNGEPDAPEEPAQSIEPKRVVTVADLRLVSAKTLWHRARIDSEAPRIYIAGRMGHMEFKPFAYGHAPEGRALLHIALDKSDGKGEIYREGEPVSFWFGTKEYTYVGPFALGDNHGCLNDNQYHMIDEFSYGEVTQQDVVDVCKRQIASADLVFVWLGSDSDKAHGTLAEIGYAKGLGKLVFVASTPADSKETWFAKLLADSWFECEDFISAFRQAVIAYEEQLRAA